MSHELSNSALLSFLSAAQPSLVNPALNPDDIKLDHRDTADILAFLAKLAGQFNYYDTKNEIDGDWKSFFETDKHALYALIIEDRQEMAWQRISDFLKGLPYTTNIDDIAQYCWGIFEVCFEEILTINQWYLTFTKYYTNEDFQVYLKQAIWQQFSFSLAAIYNLYHKALIEDLINDKSLTDPLFRKLQKLDNVWNFNPFPYNPDVGSKPILKDLDDYTQRLESAVKDFYNLHEALRKRARLVFEASLIDQSASPHMTLIISFLKLYKYQQKALNQMVERHMRFYYHDVLDFRKKGASPDSAFVLFELGKNVTNYSLPKATLLDAGKNASGNAIQFETNKSLLVTPSQIGTYLSLYSSEVDDKKYERVLNTATLTKYDSPATDKLTGNFVSFPMFGNTDANANITNDTATLGFAISSPELLLEGGNRQLTITFQLVENITPINAKGDNKSGAAGEVLSNLKKSTDAGEEGNEADSTETSVDLSGLFDFELTAAKKWIAPYCQTVTLTGSTLVVELSLNQAIEATAAYDEKKHGPGFDTSWPVLKATILPNPEAVTSCKTAKSDTPASYLNYNAVESLSFSSFTIDCVVTDLNTINLVVNGKKMPATSAAAPFGSIPEVGSRVLVSSYETFLKHITDVCISTNWVNLPDAKSFPVYYDAYNSYLKKYMPSEKQFAWDNYKATLQWLDQGQWQGSDEESLFAGGSCSSYTIDYEKAIEAESGNQSDAPTANSDSGNTGTSGGDADTAGEKKRGFVGRLFHSLLGWLWGEAKKEGKRELEKLITGTLDQSSNSDQNTNNLPHDAEKTATNNLLAAKAPQSEAATTAQPAADTAASANTTSTDDNTVASTSSTPSPKKRRFFGRLIHSIFGRKKKHSTADAASSDVNGNSGDSTAKPHSTSDSPNAVNTGPGPVLSPWQVFLRWLHNQLTGNSGKNKDLTITAPPLTPVNYPFSLSNFEPELNLVSPLQYTDKSKSGFFAIQLEAPDLAFGNSIYAQVVSTVTLSNTILAAEKVRANGLLTQLSKLPAKAVSATLKKIGALIALMSKMEKSGDDDDTDFEVAPNKPFIPKIKGTTLSYKSSYTLTPGEDDNQQFYQIHPYGTELTEEAGSLVPQYPEWAYVFLGFDELQYNTTFSLFLGMEDRLETKIQENFTEVKVELLTDDGWVATDVQSDSTYGLNISGIISFQISAEVSNQNPIMPTGSYWIRLAANEKMMDNAFLTMIGTNAAEVTRVINSSNDRDSLQNVPAGTISGLTTTVSAIAKVTQPYISFGGEEPENQDGFYQSVSERISQKGRGNSIVDYQSLILEQFKEIYQVNVVPGKYRGDKLSSIDIAVVPVIDASSSTNPYRPIAPANDLSEVMLLLQDKVNPHLSLEVQHAEFEEILISVDVTFADADQYFENIEQLNSDLKDFLSPWIAGNELAHQREALYTMELIKFIRNRSYVTSFQNLSIYHAGKLVYGRDTDSNENIVPRQIIAPKDPLNILVSAEQHNINATIVLTELDSAGQLTNTSSNVNPTGQ